MEDSKKPYSKGIGPKRLNILTFNWHEAYISSLAKTNHLFDVVERFKGGSKSWFYQTRPLPENALLIDEASAINCLEDDYYDLVICHNFRDLNDIKRFNIPKILLFHNKLTTELTLDKSRIKKADYLAEVIRVISKIDNLKLVFISNAKKVDWELEGSVITPGIDLNEYYGYIGSEEKALRVGNFMKARDLMMGYTYQQKILDNIPNTLLGINEKTSYSRFTTSWNDLKEQYRLHRIYLNTTVHPYEDGYNLAMLEAMATGMPVISTENKTSPIINDHNGYISADLDYLNNKTYNLLKDIDKAKELGENARETVKRDFSMKDFIEKWNTEFCKLVKYIDAEKRARTDNIYKIRTRQQKKRLNILLGYVSYPVTTATFIEKYLRNAAEAEVITFGPKITNEIIKIWNLDNMKAKVKDQNIPSSMDVDMKDIMGKLPPGWRPDLFLWIESAPGFFPASINELPFRTACYLIDSHIHLPLHLDWALNFDSVFIAQKEYLVNFREHGCSNVNWLPLGTDPYKNRVACFIDKIFNSLPESQKEVNIKIHSEGRILEELNEFQLAFQRYGYILDKDIDNKLVVNDLIKLLWKLGLPGEALKYTKGYLDLHLADTDILMEQCRIHFHLKMYSQAIEDAEKILIFAPEDSFANSILKNACKEASFQT